MKDRLLALMLMLCCLVPMSAVRADDPNAFSDDIEANSEREIHNALISKQERKTRADRLVLQGNRLMELRRYEEARETYNQALQLDYDNAQARAKLEEVRRYLPSLPQDTRVIIESDMERAKIYNQEQDVEAQANYSIAEQAYTEAEGLFSANADDVAVTKVLRTLNDARRNLALTAIKLKSLPATVDTSGLHKQSVALEAKVNALMQRAEARKQDLVILQARDHAASEKAIYDQRDVFRINTLLSRAHQYVEQRQYEEAMATTKEILLLDPVHEEATALLKEIRTKQLDYNSKKQSEAAIEERKRVLEEIAANAVPAVKVIEYPANWNALTERNRISAEDEGTGIEEWRLDIMKKLQEPISFQFDEQPLADVVRFLQNYTGINFILDVVDSGAAPVEGEEGAEGEPTGTAAKTVTLEAHGMRLENALRWIMISTGLDYQIKDEAIRISPKSRITGTWSTRVYDVSDIADGVNDAESIDVTGDDDDDDDDDDNDNTTNTEDEIKLDDIIKQLSPTFEGGQGMARLSGNSLVVYQTDDIHKTIEITLAQLRAAQAIQVAVTTRFLTLRDDFWEQFSSSFGDFSNSLSSSASSGTEKRSFSGTWNNNGMGGIISIMGANIGTTVSPSAGLSASVAQSGWLGSIQSQWFVRLVKENACADELFAPHLIVYNNRQAWIQLDTRIPYISNYNASGSTQDPVISYVTEGTKLQIRPTVSADKRYVTVNVEANVSRVLAMGTAVQRSTTTIANNNNNTPGTTAPEPAVTELPIELPTTFIHQTQTYATMPDGGSILISGLAINIDMRAKSGVPIVSDVPVLGNIFSNRVNQKEKRNFVIMVNARMYLLDEEEARLSR